MEEIVCWKYDLYPSVYLWFLKVLIMINMKIFFFTIQPEDPHGELDYRYDEFGFKVEEEGRMVNMWVMGV